MTWLIPALAVVPIIELALLIEIGRRVGVWYTVALVLLTGSAGLTVARMQGLSILTKLSSELSQGQIPGNTIVDGVLLLIGAVLLITPGVLTDLAGLLLLVPPVRAVVREWLKARLKSWVSSGSVWVFRR
ncbi:MAG: FxsA family protein [Ignavibacteriales bacterium]